MVLAIIAGVLYYFSLQKSDQTIDSLGSQGASSETIDVVKSDLGKVATTSAPNPLTDENITSSALKNKATYQKLITTYGVLPEQLLAMKTAYAKGDTSVFPPVNLKMNFVATQDIATVFDQQAKLADALGQVPIYSFDNNFDLSYIQNLAKSFGLVGGKFTTNSKGYIVGSQAAQSLSFNPISGAFLYSSGASAASAAPSSQDAIQKAQNYLINNPALSEYVQNLDQSETTTYQRKDSLGVTYVAMHRGWNPLPVLNVRGATQTRKLGKTIHESVKNNLPYADKDASVMDTSDNTNGYARADDFNTITVGVAADGVTGVWGNMRPLGSNAVKAGLISAKEALNNANAGEIFKPVITTIGKSQIDPSILFPNGLAEADNATVTSIYLAYLEEPLSVKSSFLQPVYILKGQTTLKSGYEVSFGIVTPAAKGQAKVSSLLEVSADTLVDQSASIQSSGESQDGSSNNLGVGYVPIGSLPGKIVDDATEVTSSSYLLDIGITDAFGFGSGNFAPSENSGSSSSLCGC